MTHLCVDGSTYAFTDLNLEDKGLENLGDQLTDFDHLRFVNLNKNRLENIDKLRNLKYLQSLSAKEN